MAVSAPGYKALDDAAVRDYVASFPALIDVLEELGGQRDPASWHISEIGDGNLNLVFKVLIDAPVAGDASPPFRGIIVKQALPYVRLVGEGWPLSLRRAHFEHLALVEHGKYADATVPAVLHYDETMALIAMQLFHPHIILRSGLVNRVQYPKLAVDMATYLARTLFHTSDLCMSAAAKKGLVEAFSSNTAMCKLTEDVVFTEPFTHGHSNNSWTSPQLDDAVQGMQQPSVAIMVCRLKRLFLSSAEALLHGDLHTGSIMVTNEETKVIDPEFAFMGPMGFDVGNLIANLLLSFFSHHEDAVVDTPITMLGTMAAREYQAWLLETIEATWTEFESQFTSLWAKHITASSYDTADKDSSGDGYPRHLFKTEQGMEILAAEQQRYMSQLFQESLGFAGCEMTRRVVGIAKVADLTRISDVSVKASCERRVLDMAKAFICSPEKFSNIRAVVDAAKSIQGHIDA